YYKILLQGVINMEHLMNVFKILSDETRLRIVVLLKQKQLKVFEICEILELPQSKVSKHLTKLKDLRFVIGERDGQYICYELKLIDPILCNLIDEIILSINNYDLLAKDKKRLLDIKGIIT
ncbi:metalloregulator ArsR/SmtB family transcription factor, partial [Clostridiaceae bacterium HSG29]|nr:metalloregulator ArsR/SmtB family transcription factor [Clostridiaceae bacterium HSG29]